MDANGFFNEKGNQLGAITKRCHIAVFNGTPSIRHKAGGTEVTVTKVSTGVFKLAINNGGNRKSIINGVTPIIGATFVHAVCKGLQAVYTVTCTAENANTTLNNKGFVIPGFNYTTGKPELVGFWYNIASGGTQPVLYDPNGAPADRYEEITGVSASDTAADVATATESVIEGSTSNSVDVYTSSPSSAVITVTDNRAGDRNYKEDGPTLAESTKIDIGAGTSGFTVAETTEGHDGVGNAECYVGFYNTSHSVADPEAFLVSYTVFPEPREQ